MKVVGQSPTSAPATAIPIRQLIVRYGVYVSLAILLVIAFFVSPSVYSNQTVFLILRQASQLGMVAIGQTLVMLVAGLDLSVTGVIVLTAVVIAEVGGGRDAMILPGILLSLALGALIGLGNGLLVTKRNVPPFVATLGMLVLVTGATLAHTRGIPSGQVPNGLKVLNQAIGPLPVSFILWLVFNLIFGFILYATPFGRRMYAAGSSREAARLSGISVDFIVISVYMLGSLMAVVAGIVLTSYVGYVDRYLGRGFDLDSIAAAVVGGIAFTGGRGNLLGTMAGVLLITFLSSMMLVLELDIQEQLAVKGLVIIAAVSLYSIAGRKA